MGQGGHLRELVRSLGWSYAVLWSIPPLMTELVWTDGWYEARSLKVNVERMFNSSYRTCSFAPGSGYVGKVFTQGQHIWLNGDAVQRQSITPGQATFFNSAGIQTLLCFPWFNGVVELGAERLVPQNPDLLQQIRRFLSNTPAFRPQQQLKFQGSDDTCYSSRFSSLSSSEGALPSHGISSDEAEGGGLSDTTLNQPVDSCRSLSLEDRLRQHFRLPAMAGVDGTSCYWSASPAAENTFQTPPPGKSSSLSADFTAGGLSHHSAHNGSNEVIGVDWRLDFGSDINNLTSSPTSTLQQVFTSLPGVESEDFDSSSFLVSSAQGTSRSFGQTAAKSSPYLQHQQHQTATKTSSSSISDEISSHQLQIRRFSSTKPFKPWKGQRQVLGVRRQKNQPNQVLLQKSIKMVHQISLLNQKKEEKKRSEHVALTMRRASAEPREVHSCHDEAAINHMLAERKRREKQKENFSALRALIPFVSKMDRASILGDAIQYVKQLKSRVQELESMNRELEAQIPNRQPKPNSSV